MCSGTGQKRCGTGLRLGCREWRLLTARPSAAGSDPVRLAAPRWLFKLVQGDRYGRRSRGLLGHVSGTGWTCSGWWAACEALSALS